MKKRLLFLFMMLAGVSMASAQTEGKYYSEKAKDNIFISGGFGAQANLNSENKFGKVIMPYATLSVGKWMTPVWGFRGQFSGWEQKMNMNRNSGLFSMDGNSLALTPNGEDVYENYTYISTNLDIMLNLSNLICGYNPDRIFNLSLVGGPGLTFARDRHTETLSLGEDTYSRSVESGHAKAFPNIAAGLLANFHINKYWSIDIEARGVYSPSIFGKYSNNVYAEGNVGATIGATYTFGGRKFVQSGCKVDVDALNNEINKYRGDLAQAQADLADARNALAQAKNVQPVEVVKEVQVAGPHAIFFKIGSAKLDDYGKVNVQLAAKTMKANPDRKYKIGGYCDTATGSASWNKKLSEKRAQTVYDALIAEGVSEDQIEIVANGGTENMFGSDKLNRVVIME